MGKCIIVAAGESSLLDFVKNENDYIIAADAGLKYLEKEGIVPDMVVGDFDTLKYVPNHPNVISLKPEKDVTDTWEAVQQGIKRGYREFHIYCGLGGRIEHSVANIQLLANLAKEGYSGYLYNDKSILTVIKNGEIRFEPFEKGFISVFSLSDKSMDVDIEGLKYEVRGHMLTDTFPLGVSNEFVGKESRISVREGILLIIWPRL
ncbi:MAG: thiamine diphosphokinase [Lachnospiraceae bacterium]|nr:thiamine diphosphokinase [Lachnospiraceae bacterium]